ncbi:MAG TPA: polysaccharide pyruvyl transferase CsaB [Acidaminococcaceae bacterium]|nr:polysaccharide pyruvyl transferase CsaB [Acidaminococcaceae bacterium]
MSKIVISGYYGFNNAGDEALLTAILASLRAVEPKADITVISGNPGNTIAKHQVKSLYRFAAVRLLRAIGEADLVISGGGSLLQDVTSMRSLLYYLSIIAAAKWKGRKVMLFAQGIGPIRNRFMRVLTRMVVNKADLITVRDRDSAEELERMGVSAVKVDVTADPVLMLNPESRVAGKTILKEAGLDPYKPIIGVSVRVWPDNQRCLKQLAAALGTLSEKYNAQIAILPLQVSMDLKDSQLLQSYLPDIRNKVTLLQGDYSTEEFLSIIGSFRLLIGMRLHALIFAAVMKVPLMAISYDPKVDSFLKAIGAQAVGTVETLNAAKVENAAGELWGQKPQMQEEHLVAMRELAQSTVSKAFDLLRR